MENTAWWLSSKKRKLQNSILSKHITFSDTTYLALLTTCTFLGAMLIIINNHFFHFPTVNLLTSSTLPIQFVQKTVGIFLSITIFLYALTIRSIYPRTATFLWGYTAFFLSTAANIILLNGIQSTPFLPIDEMLVKLDTALGINTPELLTWTYHHPHIRHLLNIAYDSLVFELFLIPFLLICFNAHRALSVFFIAELLTFLIGALIYYFFPTMAPSGIFHSPYFSAQQHDTSMRFYEIHHYIHAKLPTDGGLIAFPSFHVVWTILLTNCLRDKKGLFYPLALWNSMVIASTVLLGWHYLTDVIGGFVLAIIGIYVTENYVASNRSTPYRYS